MNEHNYHDDRTHISASLLKKYAISPREAWRSIYEPQPPTEALILGTCFHEMMETGAHTAIVFNPDNRPEPDKTFGSKPNKEWKEAIYASNERVISAEQDDQLQTMMGGIRSSEIYAKFKTLEFISAEKPYFKETAGIKVKCKPDAVYRQADGGLLIVDWKTVGETLTTNEWQYRRIIQKYGYDIQAVHYSEILSDGDMPINFVFVFVDRNGDVMPIFVPRGGEMQSNTFNRWLDLLHRCDESLCTGVWPGVEKIVEPIIL